MKTRINLFLLLSFLLPASVIAGTATLKGWSRSIFFSSFRDYDASFGYYDVVFTTSDGSAVYFPYYYTNAAGNMFFSQEMRQRGTSSYFDTDYAVWSEYYITWVQFGFMSLAMPVNDANGNSVPDWLERENSCSENVTGWYYVDWPTSLSYTPAATLTRSSGSLSGTYSLRIGTGPTTSGTWAVGSVSGTITYDRLAGSVSCNVHVNDGTIMTGSTTLTCQNHNQVTLGPLTLSGSDDTIRTPGNTVLTRNGARYIGAVSFADGNTLSPWPDFTEWVIELIDNSDSDSDGVPDLSDSLLTKPNIELLSGGQPRFNFQVQPGYSYRLLMTTNLTVWSEQARIIASSSLWQYTPPAGPRGFFRILSP